MDRYPNGISPYGCYDMVGNVWEWTDRWYDKDKETKMLCGGSWNFIQEIAHCASRVNSLPERRNNDVGFRCVRTLK